jgi:hypothetical protein
MLKSDSREFIFVHIQKTAGTSIEKMLKRNAADAAIWHGRHGHAMAGLKEIGPERWHRYFTFAFVRNPWDRLVSYYAMIKANIDQLPWWKRLLPRPFDVEIWNYVHRNSGDFRSFLENCTGTIYDKGAYKSFLFNQCEYISDADGRILVDHVGRFENLREDAGTALARIGIQEEIPMLNRSGHEHYRNYYDASMRELVRARVARDIEAFGYEF